MKKGSDEFLSEAILEKVNAKIEEQLQEELENPEKNEPKIEERIGIFQWIMLIILVSIVIMKFIFVLLAFLK